MNVCGYVRVSTDNQLENYRIEEQTERIKAYCKAKGWKLVKIYTDGGYSGGNVNRPALQQMLKDIHNGKINLVVVYKLDRLSRSQKDTLTLIEDEFISNNVDFISINENFDTSSPFGRAMIGILSVFAQLEKDQITERFTMGRIGRAKSGYYHGGSTPPTGYDYEDGNLVINEYEGLQIKEIFKLFLNGQSINAIQRHMSKHYTNKYGGWASHATVSYALRNPIYIGKVRFKGEVYDGNHEPIIDETTFNRVQELLVSEKRYGNNRYAKTPFKAKNLLTSLVYCKRCGARYFGNHGKYTCYSRAKTNRIKVLDPNCKNEHWPIEKLDTYIKDEILKLAYNDDYFRQLTSGLKPASDTNRASKRINEIDKQTSRMIDLYQVGNIPMHEITERIEKLKSEKEAIIINMSEESQAKTTIEQAADALANVVAVFKDGDIPQQRMLVRILVDYIEVDGENVHMHWAFI